MGCQQFLQGDLQKGLVAGGRCEISELFLVFLVLLLLQHYYNMFVFRANKLFLGPWFTIWGNREQVSPVQAHMNILSTLKPSIIQPQPGFQGLSSTFSAMSLRSISQGTSFFAWPRPTNPLSHLCLHKPSHPFSPVVNVTSFDLSSGYTVVWTVSALCSYISNGSSQYCFVL